MPIKRVVRAVLVQSPKQIDAFWIVEAPNDATDDGITHALEGRLPGALSVIANAFDEVAPDFILQQNTNGVLVIVHPDPPAPVPHV